MGIQNEGGWLNDSVVDHFADYARVVYDEFGDRVKWWLTFNEPHVFCLADWNYGVKDPFEEPPKKPYICAHNVIKAHAKAWRIYDEDFRPSQQGKMGITLNCDWSEPKNPNDPQHVEAMERSVNFRVKLLTSKNNFVNILLLLTVWLVGSSSCLWRISPHNETTC